MDTLELKPRFFSPPSSIFLLAAIIVTGIMGVSIWPRLYELYTMNPNLPEVWQVFIATSSAILIVWVMYFISLASSLGRKIQIDNLFVYFLRRHALGFGAWKTERILNFSKIKEVTQREKKMFNGKTMVILYYLIFHMTDGSTQELLLNDWDIHSMRELFLYMKGRHSGLKFNTIVLRDSPERISGLDEYLKKVR